MGGNAPSPEENHVVENTGVNEEIWTGMVRQKKDAKNEG
jgi:hypothetical protein